MKEVPKKDEEDVGGGTVLQPCRALPPDDTYPPMPACPVGPLIFPGPYDPGSTT